MYSGWIRGSLVLYIAIIMFTICIEIIHMKHNHEIAKVHEILTRDLSEQPSRSERGTALAGIYGFKITEVVKYGKWKSHGVNQLLVERALISFDLDIDVRNLFQINTKQIYIYIVAEHIMTNHPVNNNIIFDHIIRDRESAMLTFTNREAEYMFASDQLKGANVTFKLCWELFPVVGFTQSDCGGKFNYKLPDDFDETWIDMP